MTHKIRNKEKYLLEDSIDQSPRISLRHIFLNLAKSRAQLSTKSITQISQEVVDSYSLSIERLQA